MEIILNANDTILKILKRFHETDSCCRMMKYCVETHIDDGVLLFNVLTREMLLLTDDEYSHFREIDYLKERWFTVPENANEKEYVDFLRWVLNTQKKKLNPITGYTIFTTTDCNARCFYCFEHGAHRISMSPETSLKVVQYIKEHCGGKSVNIFWFGGEPLFNQEAMDIISAGLREAGIEYTSSMISNGYLFDDEAVKKAVTLWNLKKVQITLDGTEEVYNRVKAYIYRDGNPYQIVLNNVERLIGASVKTTIRLNMDMYNADDLLALSDELGERFGGKKNIQAYATHLYKDNDPMAELYSDEEWEIREAAMKKISEKLINSGLLPARRILNILKSNYCMADKGSAITILPDGNIGLCDQHLEDEFIGHIDSEGFDEDLAASWSETIDAIPECTDCFYYPDCIKLKKCGTSKICFPYFRRMTLAETKRSMVGEYERWLSGDNDESDSDGIDLC